MDEKVFDMLTAYIVENQNRFYKLAYSYVKNREDALDAVQSAVCRARSMEKSYGMLRRLKPGSIGSW